MLLTYNSQLIVFYGLLFSCTTGFINHECIGLIPKQVIILSEIMYRNKKKFKKIFKIDDTKVT